ncbi:hypothetical protein CPLU01_13557 [Colletotrichum plurivorum]|uniref:Uncharacterized protein n=1 Tax=Colletotrichum plurivorum TaxID=2175906 RepID=A0A8H6JQJ7_9PEZI|nr:hypothetical protein CPLU01_13557 [Colletotrichum plurivorum]
MAGGSPTFKPLVETHYYVVAGQELSTVFTLPPQTTPFTPRDPTCTKFPRAIRCENTPEGATPGHICWGLKHVEESTAWVPEQCFPETFMSIWSPFNTFSDIRSLAYPGTACISGWTSACNTTISLASVSREFLQTWCCPSGDWKCYTATGKETPLRDCFSIVSTPTHVWFYNVATTGRSDSTIWSSFRKVALSDLPGGGPIQVNHQAFPLYGHSTQEAAQESGLPGGAIAGISIGIVVIFLLFIGSSVFICLRKRKREKQAQLLQVDANTSEAPGHDTKQELPGHGSDIHMTPVAPVELPPYTRAMEVEADSRPVELAT